MCGNPRLFLVNPHRHPAMNPDLRIDGDQILPQHPYELASQQLYPELQESSIRRSLQELEPALLITQRSFSESHFQSSSLHFIMKIFSRNPFPCARRSSLLWCSFVPLLSFSSSDCCSSSEQVEHSSVVESISRKPLGWFFPSFVVVKAAREVSLC